MGISFDDVFSGVLSQSDLASLRRTTNISEIKNKSLRCILEEGYNHPSVGSRMMSSIVNSIFTQKSRVFILSYRSCCKLMKDDVNGNGSGIDSKDYKIYKARLHTTNYIETLRAPKGRRAGVYKLINTTIVSLLNQMCGEEFFEAQEKAILDYYDNSDRDGEDGLSIEQAEERMDKLKKELRKRKENGNKR